MLVEVHQGILEEIDGQFYRRLDKVIKSRAGKNGKVSEEDVTQINDALTAALLQETRHEVCMPNQINTKVWHLQDLEDISIEAAKEAIKKPKLVLGDSEIEAEKELSATAMPEIGVESPEFQCCSLYHAIAMNIINAEGRMVSKRSKISGLETLSTIAEEDITKLKKDIKEKGLWKERKAFLMLKEDHQRL